MNEQRKNNMKGIWSVDNKIKGKGRPKRTLNEVVRKAIEKHDEKMKEVLQMTQYRRSESKYGKEFLRTAQLHRQPYTHKGR